MFTEQIPELTRPHARQTTCLRNLLTEIGLALAGRAGARMAAALGIEVRYNTVRPFLSLLGESDALGAAPAGRRVLKAVRRLPALSRRRMKDRPLLPREVDAELVPGMWRRTVFSNAKIPQGAVDRGSAALLLVTEFRQQPPYRPAHPGLHLGWVASMLSRVGSGARAPWPRDAA